MKSWLLLLALQLSVAAETLGTLGRVSGEQATFLEGGQIHTYHVPNELAQRLSLRGIGSRWEYNPEGSLLQAAIDRGNDPDVQAALRTLGQFVQAVNDQQWSAAAACMPAHSSEATRLPAAFARHTLSPHTGDWALLEYRAGQMVVKIHSIRGGVLEDSFESTAFPTDYFNQFQLTHQGYRWLVDSFR